MARGGRIVKTTMKHLLVSWVGYGLVAGGIVTASFIRRDLRLLILLVVPALVAGWLRHGAPVFGLVAGATVTWAWQADLMAEVRALSSDDPEPGSLAATVPFAELLVFGVAFAMLVASAALILLGWTVGWACSWVSRRRARKTTSRQPVRPGDVDGPPGPDPA